MTASAEQLNTDMSSLGEAQAGNRSLQDKALQAQLLQEKALIDSFIILYQQLNKDNLHLLGQVYSDDIEFSDPLHHVSGLPALTNYFANLYQNVASIDFDIHQVIHQQGAASLKWTMVFSHSKLNAGADITVNGVSILGLNSKIYQHQDFFDLGTMLYEHIPLVGSLVKLVKAKASQ
ncbi:MULTISPECIES: nuclear transport factor 2 family protein [unclassified Shewanella]|uniref:nuclear transport factor 2 family protein n=1 Tax=unclassified Shewanella TaxID=196818 RepID=UPI001BBA951C|nr:MULTISPECIES: nuclear transport factor 2 family protein [unclassified Shewanella]GIU12144.1 transcriptional regulator [Shewanella sp. MBTL60-112-B1]GIU31659.1 transcriptional regulator [Shewanella sp. MBTL60-112-B2]